MSSEWDVLKAHARAQCVTAKDRLWCEMALAFGEAARVMERMERTLGPATPRPEGYYTRTVKDYEAIRKAATAAEMARRASAERKAAKAAKQAACDERKRMRRGRGSGPYQPSFAAFAYREELKRLREKLIDARSRVPRWENGICYARDDVRDAELRYAIACAEAGAVPGGRVH